MASPIWTDRGFSSLFFSSFLLDFSQWSALQGRSKEPAVGAARKRLQVWVHSHSIALFLRQKILS